MSNKRIFVIWFHPLFHDSVRMLLVHPNIEWIGEATDIVVAEEKILQNCPDTVIFEEIDNSIPDRIVAIPEKCPSVEKVIGFNLNNNELRIYHHEQKVVAHVNDLIQSIIKS